MKILIVDDHQFIIDDLIDDLKELLPDAKCVGTTKPAEIPSLFERDRFDVVFMDIEMPGTNGIKLARTILAANPRINIIYITGFSSYAVEAFKTFASGFLEKPIIREELKDALDNLRYPVSNITDEMIMQEYSGKGLIGKKITKMREERGMSRQEFADAMGVAGQTVYRWESGERVPDMPTFLRIMKVLGIDSEKLI